MGARRLPSGYNVVAESFFHTLKTGLVNHKKYHTREAAQQDIFEYIDSTSPSSINTMLISPLSYLLSWTTKSLTKLIIANLIDCS